MCHPLTPSTSPIASISVYTTFKNTACCGAGGEVPRETFQENQMSTTEKFTIFFKRDPALLNFETGRASVSIEDGAPLESGKNSPSTPISKTRMKPLQIVSPKSQKQLRSNVSRKRRR
ncbi:unnamed protein product [Protopolystoma xenopodis]|uniref:Uncharacterized protein n=1 Tax=Protopolystoma xenopodis TaxID=117903 RepID=A0A3S5BND0_9PLAT|nr:unnamed protein product [Protopolystoma xenopodis]